MTKIIRYHKISNIKYISLHGAYLSFEWWFCNKAVSDSKDTYFISHSKTILLSLNHSITTYNRALTTNLNHFNQSLTD